ncbi:RNA polymerase sigma-70 factor (ECF subfamily) [Brevibacillus sp. AG162]|uniref:RNA polymerase sigma-70 factor n=1 Tax=Brevibacillus sp. AG162 TaxID=2572910 RepID=UPI001154E2A1|nr:RNA polymerase sigma-70 factor [Brevibacillus sp. AG162]TQK62313.1 RNA polymerase sigma-70 factor (ECF subfamily) [Brevibacillus sp. AG162]
MNIAEQYELYRPLLFSIAYRLLGSVSDAEDIVQETFVAWTERDGERSVTNTKSYLCRIASNLCADRIRKQTKQRETYIGPWLPDPLVEGRGGPEDICIRRDTISTAYLLLLLQLSEVERIIFVLREAFGFSYEEIADLTGKSVANCRQIFHRARRGMPRSTEEETPTSTQTVRAHQIVRQFMQSFESGDISRVMELLTADVALIMDGGGKVKAALNPILTTERVIAFFTGTASKLPEGMVYHHATVNGLPGFVFMIGETVHYVLSVELEGNRISRFYMTVNPDKLVHLNMAKTSPF